MTARQRRTITRIHVAIAVTWVGILGLSIADGNGVAAVASLAAAVLAGQVAMLYHRPPTAPRRESTMTVRVEADVSDFKRELAGLERRARELDATMRRVRGLS